MNKRADCSHQWETETQCAPAFRNHYRCPCGETWTDVWSCQCNDKCPSCNKEIEPYKSKQIAACACEVLGAA